MGRPILIFSLVLGAGISAKAEYRAFLLQIKSANGESTRSVKSNLDPLQYPLLYHLQKGETISYTETWMCKGRTDRRPICKSPRELAAEKLETAAGDTAPTETPSTPLDRAPAESKN